MSADDCRRSLGTEIYHQWPFHSSVLVWPQKYNAVASCLTTDVTVDNTESHYKLRYRMLAKIIGIMFDLLKMQLVKLLPQIQELGEVVLTNLWNQPIHGCVVLSMDSVVSQMVSLFVGP
jgi:hypothetical protein